jgi:uncharacterized membrane protein YhiD involved in acid resistance
MDQHTTSQPPDRLPTGEEHSASRSHVARHPLVMALVIVLLLGTLALLNGAAPFAPAAPRATDAGVGTSSPSAQEFQRAVGAAAQLLPASPSDLRTILLRLLLAALLGTIISFRGSRRRNEFLIVHTNMIIAMTGALMMIIIGSDLARAFGLVGVSSIARFRTPVSDPRALAALVVSMGAGVAVGVGLYELAFIGALLLVLLQSVPEKLVGLLPRSVYNPQRSYTLSLQTEDGSSTIVRLNQVFGEHDVRHRLLEYDARAKKDGLVKVAMAIEAPATMTTEDLALLIFKDGVQSVSIEEEGVA